MKKIIFILLCLFSVSRIEAQTTAKGPFQEINFSLDKTKAYSINPTNYARPKLKFKHSAGPQSCSNCMCPLGICIQIPFFSAALTSAQIEDGYGTAGIAIVNSKLVLTFDQEAAMADGTIVIEADFFIGSEYSAVLGFTSVIIKAGTYTVTYPIGVSAWGQCAFDYDAQ